MSDKVVKISVGSVNDLLSFVGASEHLPPGWTVARVAHLVSRVQGEAAASRDDESADDQADVPVPTS
jgi:hypothetical protein